MSHTQMWGGCNQNYEFSTKPNEKDKVPGLYQTYQKASFNSAGLI